MRKNKNKSDDINGRMKNNNDLEHLPPRKMNVQALKRLLGYVWRGYKFRFFLVMFAVVLSTFCNIYNSYFFVSLFDKHIPTLLASTTKDYAPLAQSIGLLGIFSLIGVGALWVTERTMAQISQGVLKTIRDDMFEHMQSLPVKYFDTNAAGDIMSHYTNDTDALRGMLFQSIPQVLDSVSTIVITSVFMLRTNLILSLFVGVYLVFMFKVTGTVSSNSGKYFMQRQKSTAAMNGFIEERLEGQKVIKVFNHEEINIDEFEELNESLTVHTAQANRYMNILMPITASLTNLLTVLISVFGGILALLNIGGLTLGVIIGFLRFANQVSRPFGRIAQQLNLVVMGLAGADRIFALLDQAPEEDDGTVRLVNARYVGENIVPTTERTGLWAWESSDETGNQTYTLMKGQIHLKNVDFSYIAGKQVLKNISIHANPGDKLSLVGQTGAGKTTITNLINRFYDIDGGEIIYDGININTIRKPDLRRSLGVVLQNTNLFTDTILNNIRYADPDAAPEVVVAAATLVNAHGFINMLSEGYDTVLTDGGENLSHGQRQLLSIARAALADPPAMILDEATSSIDTRTEVLVQDGMDALMYGRTVFVIAHRLSTIYNSDAILVMDHGEIIERGTHDALVEQKGMYYQLYTGAIELE